MSTEIATAGAPGGDLETLMRLLSGPAFDACKALAASEFAPKAYAGKPQSIAIAAAQGARLGLDLFSSIQNIAVINGRPTLWGDAMLAVCQRHPHWRGMDVEWSASNGNGEDTVTVTVRRAEGVDIGRYVGRFSVKEARTAGVWEKSGPWSQYPRRMLEIRARSFALRSAFADALMGLMAREELDDGDPQPSTGRIYELKPSAVIVSTRTAEPSPATIGPALTLEPSPAEPKTPREVFAAAVSGARSRGVDGAAIKSALSDLLERAVTTMNDVADAELDRATACVDSLTGDA